MGVDGCDQKPRQVASPPTVPTIVSPNDPAIPLPKPLTLDQAPRWVAARKAVGTTRMQRGSAHPAGIGHSLGSGQRLRVRVCSGCGSFAPSFASVAMTASDASTHIRIYAA